MQGIFITGTDTDVGKTWVAVGLISALRSAGVTVAGMKPIAAGAERRPEGLINDDAVRMMEVSSVRRPYGLVNPYCFEAPIAPHIAAMQAGRVIELSVIHAAFRDLAQGLDCLVVEGAGGWRVPLHNAAFISEIPRTLDLPVLLVVGLELGCINHAVLTAEAIRADGVPILGWVANAIDPDYRVANETIDTLKQVLDMPCLGMVPHFDRCAPDAMALHLAECAKRILQHSREPR